MSTVLFVFRTKESPISQNGLYSTAEVELALLLIWNTVSNFVRSAWNSPATGTGAMESVVANSHDRPILFSVTVWPGTLNRRSSQIFDCELKQSVICTTPEKT